jgi:hypothetical protein
MNIPECLNHLRPGSRWGLTENDYATLEWVGPGEAPTLADLEAAWEQIQSTPQPAPPAAAYQVRAYLIRNGIDLASIPTLITSITAAGAERDEALMRWEFVANFPKNHPLVAAVAASLNLDLDQVWDSILAIE